ncbi:hypothetical protein V8F20_009891, partial [Naviculisporaceae sp. PSN 640]
VMMKLDLSSMNYVYFITAADEEVAQNLHKRIAKNSSLLTISPLFALTFILEERVTGYWTDSEVLRAEVNEIETATGMVRPSWRKRMLPEAMERLADFNSQLEQLHAAHAELCHLQTVFEYLVDFSHFCVETSEYLEHLRLQLGFPHILKHKSLKYLEHVNFIASRTRYVQCRAQEGVDRFKTQVNVVSSPPAG